GPNRPVSRATSIAPAFADRCWASLFRHPRLAQAVQHRRTIRHVFRDPLNRKPRLKATGLAEGAFRLIHFAQKREGGSEVCVDVKLLPTRVERLVKFVDRAVEMAEADFRGSRGHMKVAEDWVAWA